MATTEPLTGVTVYQQNDIALGGTEIGNVASQLAPFGTPNFATTAARDAAYTAWVRQGNAMRESLFCTVGPTLYRYSTALSAWVAEFLDYAVGRVPITATGLVNPDFALTGVITVPAARVACRVTFTATGRSGNAQSARTVAWDWDSKPGSASNMTQDDPAIRVQVPASPNYGTVSSSLVMDVPAGTSATARLMYRANDNAFNSGSVIWHRGPAS